MLRQPSLQEERILASAESMRDEAVEFLREFIRIPTVNPPGDLYRPCAEFLATRLRHYGYACRFLEAEGRAEHTKAHPRVNVIGVMESGPGPRLHFNGHIDVVPAGDGWTVPPFDAVVRGGRVYGRGASDQKSGIVASILAVEALKRAGVRPNGTIEQSGTVDEESGGFAGMAYLAEQGVIRRGKTDHVVITEPLNVDRVCLGHRGVYWFRITTHGKMAHGSMPFLGVSAIDAMNDIIQAIRQELMPALATRWTSMPVEPPEARRATLNINAVAGGQFDAEVQTPCVADRCSATFDRRFLIEESFEDVRREVVQLLFRQQQRNERLHAELEDLMVVHPVLTDPGARVVIEVGDAIERVIGRRPALIASPGTYDQKHVSRIGMIDECIAYGPGLLHMAHQPDEYCEIDDLVKAIQVMALATMRLTGGAS